jgi:Family of unknown function (DUF6152)
VIREASRQPMKISSLLTVGAAAMLSHPVAWPHHSFAASFDAQQPITVTGTIAEVLWANPHIWFFLDVQDADGTVTRWGFEGLPPGPMQRVGVTKSRLAPGLTVVVEGFRVRDGSNNGSALRIAFSDGRNVLFDAPGVAASGGAASAGGAPN